MTAASLLKAFTRWNMAMSAALDRLLPEKLRRDGNASFLEEYLPTAIKPGDMVFELGGGSRPYLSPAAKERLGATVVGLDMDAAELSRAPEGAYDKVVVADLCLYRGSGEADVVVCQATLEHVPDAAGAIHAIATTLRPGGQAYIFAPCRNAAFARINRLLPQSTKRWILFMLFPHKAEGHDGFRAYYDSCVPSRIEDLAAANGLEVVEKRMYWKSSYFFVFIFAYIMWRVFQGVSYLLLRDDAAESFVYVLRKTDTALVLQDTRLN
jgi:SAM-dependent methyltransferase